MHCVPCHFKIEIVNNLPMIALGFLASLTTLDVGAPVDTNYDDKIKFTFHFQPCRELIGVPRPADTWLLHGGPVKWHSAVPFLQGRWLTATKYPTSASPWPNNQPNIKWHLRRYLSVFSKTEIQHLSHSFRFQSVDSGETSTLNSIWKLKWDGIEMNWG